jgi:hypothetical protein
MITGQPDRRLPLPGTDLPRTGITFEIYAVFLSLMV